MTAYTNADWETRIMKSSIPLEVKKALRDAGDSAFVSNMTAGDGITSGTGTVCQHSVSKAGDLYKTEIFIDMTGLKDGGAQNDIIGVDGDTYCHIGQITAAVNGTIVAGRITCLETPTTGDPDIDFYGSADEATGAFDAALTTITGEEQLIDHGDWSAGEIAVLTALPDADGYMYLVVGAATPDNGVYDAGQFLVELWGV